MVARATEVLELRSANNFLWKCRKIGCENIQIDGTKCEKCGQFQLGFDKIERRLPIDAANKEYITLDNIMYDGKHILAKSIINLADEDPATKSLLKRKLIKPAGKKGK